MGSLFQGKFYRKSLVHVVDVFARCMLPQDCLPHGGGDLALNIHPLMARSHCTEGGTGNGSGTGNGTGEYCSHCSRTRNGTRTRKYYASLFNVLETAPFVPCATVLIILQ